MLPPKRAPSPWYLVDSAGLRLGRPQRNQIRHTIPIGKSSMIRSGTYKSSSMLMSHRSQPPALNPKFEPSHQNFSTAAPVSSKNSNNTTPVRSTSTTANEEMDINAPIITDYKTDTNDENQPETQTSYEAWQPVISALQKAVTSAFESSPRPTPTSSKEQISTFNAYWRGIFSNLYKQIQSDDSIPKCLSTPAPGVKRFEIMVFTENSGLDCPCCLPEVEPANIVIENEDGLTKGDLIHAVGMHLYGLDLEIPESLKISVNGGVDEKGGNFTPTVYSEYVIETKPAYSPYLVKEGDRERTLDQELANEERPVGGWPGFGGSVTLDTPLDLVVDEEDPDGKDTGNVADVKTTEMYSTQAQESELDAQVLSELAELDVTDRSTQDILGGDQVDKKPEKDTSEVMEHRNDQDKKEDDEIAATEKPELSERIIEDDPAVYRFPAVIFNQSWLNSVEIGPNGEKGIYPHGSDGCPRIWLFCCPPEEFEARVEWDTRRGTGAL